jgi:hypothetical protein
VNARSERPTPPRLALTPEEAAASLGVGRSYFAEHIAPELRWVLRGSRRFVAVRELERWLDRAAALSPIEELDNR